MSANIKLAMDTFGNTRQAADFLGIPIRKLRYHIKREKELRKYQSCFGMVK